MTREDRNNKLKHFITCLKCDVSGKCCDDNCSTQYDAGNMSEIIENLEAISKALEQEPTTKNDLGVDCVSRKALLNATVKKNSIWNHITNSDGDNLEAIVSKLPPVTPQEPRKGHWIEEFNDIEGEVRFTCSCCGKYQLFGTDFCYHCGAKMVELQESEDNNGSTN